jgi:succinate-acetate transporter protein
MRQEFYSCSCIYYFSFLDLFYGGTYTSAIFISYGAFWAGSGLLMLPPGNSILEAYASEADLARANAIYHFIWAFYTLMHVGISLKIKSGSFMFTWCLTFVFLTLFLTGISLITDTEVVLRVSGVTAYCAGLGAYYNGIAAVFEEQGVKLWVGTYKWVPHK